MAAKKEERFELKTLMELAEPLSVTLERMVGNTTEPVALPGLGRDRNIDHNSTLGTGWTRDDVIKLTPWIRDFWTGAGTYRAQVVDQNKKVMEWEFSIPQSDSVKQRQPPPLGAPGMVPPSAIQQVQVQAAPQPQAPAPQQVYPPPAVGLQGWGGPQNSPMQGTWTPPPGPPNPWGTPPAPPQPFYPPQMQPPPGYVAGPYGQQLYPPPQPGYAPQAWSPYAPSPWGAPPQSRESETEKTLKLMQAELEASKRREIELKYQQDLERQRVEAQKQIDTLRDEIRRASEQGASKEDTEVRRLREDRERMEREAERKETNARFAELQATILKMGESPRRDEDERFRKLEEENRRRDEEHRRELEKRDAQAREDRLRAEMKENADRQERLMLELKNTNRGPDPVIEMMKENAREARASQERVAQMQAQHLQALTNSSINPMQLLTILKDRDNSGDQFIRNMMPALTGVIDLYKGAAESVVGLAGGGPAAAWQPVAEQVISSGKEIMDRYFTWKRDEGVSGNKVRIAQAQAQGQAATAAAQAQQAIASMRQPGQQNGHAGLNGAAPQQRQAQVQAAPPGAPAPQAQGTDAPPQSNVVPLRQPPSEIERFGPALESVKRLRQGVKEGALTPEKAIDAIMQGVNFVSTTNEQHPPGDPKHLVVPVFTLYAEERWADFIDQLLPDAPAQFKDECVRIMIEELEPDDDQPEEAPKDPDLEV